MYNSRFYLMVPVLAASLLNACAWVEHTEEGKMVNIATLQQVSGCKDLGKTTATIKHKVAGMQRQEHIVKDDVEKLAKNSAAEMGGDTIVPESEIKDGKQTFRVFRCQGN